MTTPQQEDQPMPRITLDQAANLTWERVSLEHDPRATHRLSADIVAYTDADEPIISVIHLDDRRHWNLIVFPDDPADRDPNYQGIAVPNLAEALTSGVIADGTQLRMSSLKGAWLTLVHILPPAHL
jgi:hypothetical protein